MALQLVLAFVGLTILSMVSVASSLFTSSHLLRASRDISLSLSHYEEIVTDTNHGIHFTDLTEQVQAIIDRAGVKTGCVSICSRHTTMGITINEMEGRLVDDTRQFLLKLCPPLYPYLHNDLHLRVGPPGWHGGDEAWRAQEPINAHSHLLNMLIGTSESVPVHEGKLKLGTWQSIILAEFDGPRKRSVAVSVTGD